MDFLLQAGLSGLDIAVLAVIVLVLPIEAEISNRTLKPRMERNEPGARLWWYAITLVELWAITLAIAWIWLVRGRDWLGLGIGFDGNWGSWIAVGVAAAGTGLMIAQFWTISRGTEALDKARAEMEAAGMDDLSIMPRTPQEYRATQVLSVTAGITEEVIYRGYLIWAFSLFVHPWIGAVMALAVFVFMHRYQDAQGLIRVAIMGAVLTALFLISGSLYPGIILHIAVDLISIGMAWRVRQAKPA